MAFERVAALSDVPPGSMIDLEGVGGDETRMVVICNIEGELHAMDGRCPHRDGPLGQGALHGRMVVCPWHAWEFDCVTGRNDRDPGLRQRKYDIRVDGEDILVDV